MAKPKAGQLSRSELMARVKSRDTSPERVVRRLLTSLGYRYRLHRQDITGNPDIAFIGRKKVIFVHGCFWHGHDCARGARVPKTNRDYWLRKIDRNRARDIATLARLKSQSWQSVILWECELTDEASILRKLDAFLDGRLPQFGNIG